MTAAFTNPAVRRLIRRELGQNKARTASLFLLTFLPVLCVGYVTTLIHTENEQLAGATLEDSFSTVMAGLFMIGMSIATGAIAYSAWGSSIRRRLRDVGLLTASGGESGHAAAVQAGQAFVISAVGSIAAIAALLIVGSTTSIITGIASPGIANATIQWPVIGLLLPAGIAVAAATLAGWWPARATARMPLAALLSGRLAAKNGFPGKPAIGLVMLVGGLGALGSSITRESGSQMMIQGTLGIIAMTVGALAILTWLFRIIGSDTIGRSLPVTLRLVLRDASRNAGRSAAAVLGIGAIAASVWLAAVDAIDQQSLAAGSPTLTLIGLAASAVLIGLVTATSSREIEEDLAAMSLIGAGPRFRADFLGLQTLMTSGVGVAAGITVGTLIRFAVDSGLPIPLFTLLTLVGFPFAIALCVMAQQSTRLQRAPTRPRIAQT